MLEIPTFARLKPLGVGKILQYLVSARQAFHHPRQATQHTPARRLISIPSIHLRANAKCINHIITPQSQTLDVKTWMIPGLRLYQVVMEVQRNRVSMST
jgi:hypothetical protein